MKIDKQKQQTNSTRTRVRKRKKNKRKKNIYNKLSSIQIHQYHVRSLVWKHTLQDFHWMRQTPSISFHPLAVHLLYVSPYRSYRTPVSKQCLGFYLYFRPPFLLAFAEIFLRGQKIDMIFKQIYKRNQRHDLQINIEKKPIFPSKNKHLQNHVSKTHMFIINNKLSLKLLNFGLNLKVL